MGVTVTAPNNGSDYVEFKNQAGTSLAKVGGYDDGSSNGHIEIYTTASGTPTERVRIDNAGNVGIGTSSPGKKLDITQAPTANNVSTMRQIRIGADTNQSYSGYIGYGSPVSTNASGVMLQSLDNGTASAIYLGPNGENVCVNGVGVDGNAFLNVKASGTKYCLATSVPVTTSSYQIVFWNPNGPVGSVTTSGSSTTYATVSDHRLKENVLPMENALATIQQLNPVTYTWKADGSDGQGFIAHELQAVVPDCVTGEKDAVDDEGNPVYQGIDTSFLVATLCKAIQELEARVKELEAK